MASGSSNWEVVGRGPKKETVIRNKNQTKKKINPDDMPKLQAAAPVPETPTMFDAFLQKEKAHQAKEDAAKSSGNGQKKPQQKKKTEKPTETVLSVEQAMAKLSVQELETVLLKDQATFPDSPLVWLKDLVSILAMRLEKVSEPDPVYKDKPKDYPLCLVPADIRDLLTRTILQCSSHTLDLFFDHCLNSCITDGSKGQATYGYRVFIQLLCREKPDLFMGNLGKYVEQMKANQSRTIRGLVILWSVAQLGMESLANSLRVWLDVMSPFLEVRALATQIAQYLEDFFRMHPDVKDGYGVVTFRDFFPVFDLVLSPQSHLASNVQKKLLQVYPKFKAVSLEDNPSSNMRNFFPSFLARCTPNCSKNMKEELLGCLTECLRVDKQCYSVWRQMYTKHLVQSSVLLSHILENWEQQSLKLDKRLLRETVRAFHVTNEEMMTAKDRREGLPDCANACKEILGKMSGPRFPWRLLLLLILSVAVGVVFYDIYISKSFQKSQTRKVLKDTGTLAFLHQVWTKIQLYTGKALDWIAENVPIYYAKVCEVVGPYLQLFWEKLYDLGVYIATVTQPHRAWLAKKIPEMIEWVQSKVPWVTETLSHYFTILWDLIVYYSIWLWQHIVYYWGIVSTWLLKNVFTGSMSPENLQKLMVSALTTIQSYTSAAVDWCIKLVSGPQ